MLSRRALIKGVLLTGFGSAVGTTTYGVAYARHQIGVTRVSLPIAQLPPTLEGLRIGFMTDVHHSAMVPAIDVSRAVDLLLAEQPDMVVLGGDYVSFGDRAFVDPVAELLSPLRAPHGVFAILGNHDDERNVPDALRKHGIVVLKDSRTKLEIKGEALELAGIRFWTRRTDEIARVLRGGKGTTLLLAHDPRRLTAAAALNVPAVISGHTHGGQVLIPGLDAAVRRRFPILHGLGSKDNTSIFVSRGVGTVYLPVRINCPPEVAIVTLSRSLNPS